MIGHVLVNTDEVVTYDYSSSHHAIDLVGAGNSVSDVISLEDGVVELVVNDVTNTNVNARGTASYGNFVKIRHVNGQKTLYAHLKYGSVSVNKGDKVSKGQKIGTMGATGNAYGVHLHFEVRNQDESRENPCEYLWGHKQIRAPIKSIKKTQPVPIPKQEKNVEKEEIKEVKSQEKPVETKKETPNQIKENVTNQRPKKENRVSKSEDVPKSVKQTIENVSSKEKKVKEETKKAEKVNYSKNRYLENTTYEWYSIVDALKEIGVDSSYDYRCLLAINNGITNYHGTANQNLKLLKLLKSGKLKSA